MKFDLHNSIGDAGGEDKKDVKRWRYYELMLFLKDVTDYVDNEITVQIDDDVNSKSNTRPKTKQ